MNRRTGERMATLLVAVGALCAITMPAGAATPADPVVVHALDIAAAEVGNALANASDPNITCSDPVVTGFVVTPNRDLGVVLVRGTDAAVAEGECLSLTNKSFSIDLSVTIEKWDADSGYYAPVCTAGTSHVQSVPRTGFAATSAQTVCTYSYPKGAVVPVHRAHAVLTNSLNGTARESYSALIWPGGEIAA